LLALDDNRSGDSTGDEEGDDGVLHVYKFVDWKVVLKECEETCFVNGIE